MKIIRILSILLCMALAPGALAGCTYTLLEPSPADVGTGGGETDPHTPESADNTDETETYVFPDVPDTPETEIPDAELAAFVDYTADRLSAPTAQGAPLSDAFVEAAADFGFSLLSARADSDNVLISPVSVLYAFGMTANGAAGETKTQMEKVLYGGIGVGDANRYLLGFRESAPAGENGVKVQIANSIWANLSSGFLPSEEFLRVNAEYFGAQMFGRHFANPETVKHINGWVSDNTDGMIEKLLDELDPLSLMVLVNTVLFDGKWEKTYEDFQISRWDFTSYDGTVTEREMMSSTENAYFRLGDGEGFVRPYAEKYSFVGILPEEGVDVFEYAASIDGAAFVEAVKNPTEKEVYVRIPSFEYQCETNLTELLPDMGITDAFSPARADFSAMGECDDNVYISGAMQVAKIELTREGTKAAAATAITVAAASAAPSSRTEIYLERPFVFAIVENESGLPVFCGIVSELD